jgi:hypothetical protein
MISWGVALLCHIPVRNKEGIYATRFFLGLVSENLLCQLSKLGGLT